MVTAWKQSGLTMRDFAAQHGLPQKRLERWSCKLRKRDALRSDPPLRLVPLQVAKPAESQTQAENSHCADAIELALPSGFRVTVRSGFDTGALERLLQVVGC